MEAASTSQPAGRESGTPANPLKAIEELKAKLLSLQQNVVTGGAQSSNQALKEEMKTKKKRAENNLKSRLKEARERGDEENVFGEIYDTLQVNMRNNCVPLLPFGWRLTYGRGM